MRETSDELRRELAELRASRERLVVAAHRDRRELERALHRGVQQQLIALAVKLQLLDPMVDDVPPEAKALLDDIARDVQEALDESTQLAERIHPPLLRPNGLAAALRAAAAVRRVQAAIDVAVNGSWPDEVVGTVYACFLEVLERTGAGGRLTVFVREEGAALSYEVGQRPSPSDPGPTSVDPGLSLLRDRAEALGGRLTIELQPDGGLRLAGSLPLSRGDQSLSAK
jgi:signal transduction histidine kinase